MDKATRNESQAALEQRTWFRHNARVILTMATVTWAVIVGTGLWMLWCYSNTRGVKETSPARWPQASRIERSGKRPSLLLFAHPKCPCTRASIRELERLTRRIHGKVETWVVFMKPSHCSDDWASTDMQQSAAAIPDVRIFCDEGGAESQRFRARTSGLALLYSQAGRLLFAGGITSSRGHEGDNDGTSALAAIVMDQNSQISQTSVFGCPLYSPDSLASQEPR